MGTKLSVLNQRPLGLAVCELPSNLKVVGSSLGGDICLHITIVLLTKAIFDRISYQFEGKAFVENVREVSKSSLYGLNKLQQQILRSVLNKKKITVRSVHEGTNMMKRMIRGRKVVIVLDDVDDIEQLEALAGEPNWFKYGSVVIITTRDKQVLLARGVTNFIDVNLLSYAEAICLLSKNAFKRDIPTEGYEDLSGQVVNYANGLPLTIKVLGSMLYGQNERHWIHTLERLKEIPLKATMEKLELSYNNLEEDHKEIFLDIVCILKGWSEEDAVMALKSCGFFAEAALRVLEQKSLITIYEDDDHGSCLGMHDHIEEMGKNIVRRLNPNEPKRHSRLWNQEETKEILVSNSRAATQCIRYLDAERLYFDIMMKGLTNMKELRFVRLNTMNTIFELQAQISKNWKLPNGLRFLRWDWYPFESLPKTFQSNYLVGLHMELSMMNQLWKDGEEKPFPKLRFLNFNDSYLNTLDLSVAPNLETLVLDSCSQLAKLHMPAECPKLISLNLMCCSDLRTLRLGRTPNLETLRLKDCTDMVELRMPAEFPKLVTLDLCNLKLRTLRLGITPHLETVTLKNCTDMVELHMPAECPSLRSLKLSRCSKLRNLHLGITPHLEALRLKDCSDMVELHMPAKCPKLVNLNLYNLKLRTLRLGRTPNLEMVTLQDCTDMVKLHMPAECPNLLDFKISNLKLRTLRLGRTPNLETLRLKDCTDMVELRMPAEFPKLVNLNLCNLKLRTLRLGITPNLETVTVKNCTDMVELHMPAECPKLVDLDMSNLKLTTLHLGITPNLVTFRLKDCTDMVELRMPAEFPKLVNLNLCNLMLRTLLLGITPNLETVSLKDCDLVELQIPADCPKLVTLDLYNLKLRTLHLGITPNLQSLRVKDCTNMVELRMPAECPKLVYLDLGYTLNLETLSLCNCMVKNLSLNFSKLRILHLESTPDLETLSLIDSCNLVELHLPIRCLKLKNLSLDGSNLSKLHLGMTPDLETLSLAGCESLVELHMPFECPKLKFLSLCNTKLSTLDLELTPNLESLDLKECHDLVKINAPFGCLKTLCYLDLTDCGNLEKLISVCNLEISTVTMCDFRCLRKLTLKGGFSEVPEFVVKLEGLEELNLLSRKIEHLPESICLLKYLKVLELKSFWLLEKLPEGLGLLQCLEKLILTECAFLRDIPNSICEMKCLKYFHLPYCLQVSELPEEIGRLECLEELDITGTGISQLPASILRVKGLRVVGSRWLLESCGFTSKIETLGDETFCYI